MKELIYQIHQIIFIAIKTTPIVFLKLLAHFSVLKSDQTLFKYAKKVFNPFNFLYYFLNKKKTNFLRGSPLPPDTHSFQNWLMNYS